MKTGVDVIQLDKVDLENIKNVVTYKNKNHSTIKIIVAGGINISNVEAFAACEVDGIVTSAVYVCGMADISSRLKLV